MDALRKKVRRTPAAAIAASIAAVMLGFGAPMVSAVPLSVAVGGYFQIDSSADVCGGGSITVGPPPPTACVDTPLPNIYPTGADDWDSLFTCSGAEGNCNPTNL